MKWKTTIVGEIRNVTKFLWFPKKITGEYRWLETATFKQVYINGAINHWEDILWCD